MSSLPISPEQHQNDIAENIARHQAVHGQWGPALFWTEEALAMTKSDPALAEDLTLTLYRWVRRHQN